MILDVFKFPDSVLVKEITVHTGDYPIKYNPEYFYYCIDEKSKLKNCIPDFTFKCWKEVGIESYDILRNQLLERSNVKPKIDKLFWAGNVKTHFSRVDFIEKFKEDKNKFEIYHVDPEVKNAKKFTILEHLDYKYLIDIQGRGYSSRLKFLLHSGRTLFIQERRWKSFYHFELIPFTHYIPIKEDFSDLYEKIKWAEMHPQESLDIAENAKKYAIENLSYESVLNVLKSKLFKN